MTLSVAIKDTAWRVRVDHPLWNNTILAALDCAGGSRYNQVIVSRGNVETLNVMVAASQYVPAPPIDFEFSTSGSPLTPAMTLFEWVSPALDDLRESLDFLKERHRVIIDVPGVYSEDLGLLAELEEATHDSGRTYVHHGLANHCLRATDHQSFVESYASARFRKQLRKHMQVTSDEGWTYTEDSASNEEIAAILAQWFMFRWGNELREFQWKLAVLLLREQRPHSRIKVMAIRKAGVLVGCDIVAYLGGIWNVVTTAYLDSVKGESPGWYAMYAASEFFSKMTPEGPVGIGFIERSPTNSFEYKRRWSQFQIPTYLLGLGLWENR